MPKAVLVAGPNGAGKSSFIRERNFRALGFRTLNADEIAKSLARPDLQGAALDLAAGRRMLRELDELSAKGRDMVVETTLASLSYAQRIRAWQAIGYDVELIYLSLSDADQAIRRVAQRVEAGGHAIPEEVVRRRFDRSRDYLVSTYRDVVDAGQIWDNSAVPSKLIESWP